ncbi:MAG: biopolymer transporter ExbD [Thermoleophilia bacterium]|nr:biopolymer transporter ExbD [Thermoleophilia bacterium]
MSGNPAHMKAEPNLTPLLDVVFQLITFFMLLINFSKDNYDARVKLPVAGTARPVDDGTKADDDRLVLNIDPRGNLLWGGQALPTSKATAQIKREADLVKLNLRAGGIKYDAAKGLPTTVVLRADRDTPFSSFYSLVSACQANGFYKFSLKAMSGPSGP